jgi:hypothetical protein
VAPTISAGTLSIGNGTTSGSITGNITNNAALAFNRSDNSTYSGVISGTGTLEKLGNGTLTLTGGQFRQRHNHDLRRHPSTWQRRHHRLTGRRYHQQRNLGHQPLRRPDLHKHPERLRLGAKTRYQHAYLQLHRGTDGRHLCQRGKLVVIGTTSAVTVNSGGTLAGNGTIGDVVINSGGAIAPGNSPGTITTGNMTWNGGGIYNWQLGNANGTVGTGWDLISSTGSLTINATSGSKFVINAENLEESGFDANARFYKWKIASFGGNITGFSNDKFQINPIGFGTNATDGVFSSRSTPRRKTSS